MPGFHKPDASERQCVSVLGDDKTAGNAASQVLFDDLRHLRARFARANHDHAASEIDLLTSDSERTMDKLNEIFHAYGRICGAQRGFPDEPGGLSKFWKVHSFGVEGKLATRGKGKEA